MVRRLRHRGVRLSGTDAWRRDATLIRTARKYAATHDASLIREGRKASRDTRYSARGACDLP